MRDGVNWHLSVEKPGFQSASGRSRRGGAGRETLQWVIKTDQGRPVLLAHTHHGKGRDLKIQPPDQEEVGTAGAWGAAAEGLPAPLGAGPVGVLARGPVFPAPAGKVPPALDPSLWSPSS